MANMMYHPVYCPHGTMKASDGKFWYETSLSIKSLYDCIVNAGTVNGRPDSKVADKVYYESNGGLVFLPTYAKSPSKHDLLEEETQKLVSGDTDMALDMGVELVTMPVAPFKSMLDYLADGTLKKSPYLLTQGKALSTDVIGNPSPYVAADALYTVPTTVNITNMSTSTLVWDEATGKMYKALVATNDIDANGVPVPAFTDTASWQEVFRGYPQSWLDWLEKGKSLAFNPLLVHTDGTSLIPDGNTATFRFSKKYYEYLGAVYDEITRNGWSTGTYTSSINTVNNGSTLSKPAEGPLIMTNYTSYNTPLIHSDPKPVELVQPKAIASNSHSWYKGAGIVNAVTGKVSVGNGTNGLESRVLENGEVCDYVHIASELGQVIHYKAYETILVNTQDTRSSQGDIVYNTVDLEITVASASFDQAGSWLSYGSVLSTTPQHNTITLDAANSPASKAFTTLAVDDNGEYVVQVFGEELAYNATTTAYDGHTSDFTQLTNGTLTDLNGAQVKTTVAIQRTGVYKGDK